MIGNMTPYPNSRITVIGIDHGYGNIKTANTCFPAGVTAYAKEPTFSRDVLYYEGIYYSVGEGHKEFTADKIADADYYILTLAAIARELELRGRTQADVYLATGLPLTWVSEQKDRFRKYLMQKRDTDFTFRNKQYHIRIIGAEVFPQGFAAIASKLADFKGTHMLCDIGNGTMNIMTISSGKPNPQKCYTEKFGVYQCTLAVREQVLRRLGTTIDDDVIEDVLRNGTADIAEKYLNVIQETVRNYVNGIMRRLREHEYNPDLMKLYIVGGGGCLIRNFADYDASRVTIDDDICATAKGYEFMAELRLKKAGSL